MPQCGTSRILQSGPSRQLCNKPVRPVTVSNTLQYWTTSAQASRLKIHLNRTKQQIFSRSLSSGYFNDFTATVPILHNSFAQEDAT